MQAELRLADALITLDKDGWHAPDKRLERTLNNRFPYPPTDMTYYANPLAAVARRAAAAMAMEIVRLPVMKRDDEDAVY